MLRLQRPDGRFQDVLDEPDSFVDGTAGLMLAACVYRGVTGGWLPGTLLAPADAAFLGAQSRIDEMGLLREVCGCPSFDHQGTSAEAQAAYLMALAWRNRLGHVPLSENE